MNENLPPIMKSESFEEFREDRGIQDGDLETIADLARLPKRIFLENHNSFMGDIKFDKDKLSAEFRRFASGAEGEKKTYYLLMAEIISAYDGPTAWNLNSLLEKRWE